MGKNHRQPQHREHHQAPAAAPAQQTPHNFQPAPVRPEQHSPGFVPNNVPKGTEIGQLPPHFLENLMPGSENGLMNTLMGSGGGDTEMA